MPKLQELTGLLAVALCTVVVGDRTACAQDAPIERPALKVGDTWVYDWTRQKGQNGWNARRMQVSIDRLDDDDLELSMKQAGAPGGAEEHLMGRDWSLMENLDGREVTTGRPVTFPLTVGKRWSSDFTEPGRGRVRSMHWHLDYKATGWVDVDTPAGKLHAIRVEAKGSWKADLAPMASTVGGVVSTPDDTTTVTHAETDGARTASGMTYRTFDYAPSVKQFAKMVTEDYDSANVRTQRDEETLVSFKPAP